jgi:hypothetical protein
MSYTRFTASSNDTLLTLWNEQDGALRLAIAIAIAIAYLYLGALPWPAIKQLLSSFALDPLQ